MAKRVRWKEQGVKSELLEGRMLHAAVEARIDSGRLHLASDDVRPSLVLERQAANDAGTILVRGVDGTTINGQASATFAAPRKGVRIDFTGGAANLTLSNVRIQSGLAINLRGDDNILLLRKLRVTGSLDLQGGTGVDRFSARDVIVQCDFAGSGGEDRDFLSLRRVQIAGELNWVDRSGGSRLDLERVEIGRDADIQLSNAADHMSILDSAFEQTTQLRTFASDDQISIHGTTFAENPAIHDGAGEDAVDRELYFKWDFANGEQGWTGDFADYSATNAGENPYRWYAFENGISEVSDRGPLDGKVGYRFAATNRSDDLFMFLSRKLSGNDGLRPNTSYSASFKIEFASDVAADLGGIGGPPATAVMMKAGGVGYPLQLQQYTPNPSSDNWQLNIKKANQSASSPDSDLSNLGNISYGPDTLSPEVFRHVIRQGTHAKPLVASADGQLWLIVGTDSGFEGRTSLYYLSVQVRLTPVQAE